MASFHKVVLCLAVVAALFTAAVAKVNCRTNYMEPGENSGHCYRLFTSTKSWEAAAQTCINDGAYLPSVRDAVQHDYLVRLYRALRQSPCNEKFLIGANDRHTEGHFVWVQDSSPVVWDNFENGEPNNSGGEDGTEINSNDGWWNDCDEDGDKRCFFCETNPIQ